MRTSGPRRVLLCVLLLAPGVLRAATLETAREQLTSGDLEAAITSYEQVLTVAVAPEERRQALEFLGVALERKGDMAAALARYREVLEGTALAPGDPQALRVRQRLRALLQALSPPAVSVERTDVRRFTFRGALRQEFFSDSFSTDDGIGDSTSSAAATTLNLSGTAATDFGGFATAIDATWLQPVGAEDDTPAALWVSQGWLQWVGPAGGQRLRVGRQQLLGYGTYGRFDGAVYEYTLNERYSVGLAAGLPVLAPGYASEVDQQFVAGRVNVELHDGRLALSPYFNVQQHDGLVDRESAGASARYRAGRFRVAAELDIDLGYQTLNLGLLDLGLQLNQRLSIFARARLGAAPFLMTGNALRGQRTDDLAVLERRYTESQLRTLARARTADELDLSVGASWALSSRWYLNAGTRYQDRSATLAVAGAVALPARQSFRSWVNLAGNSVLLRDDALYLRYSLDSRLDADEHRAAIEWRLPLLRGWQLAPLLGLERRDAVQPSRNRTTFVPGVRLSGRWRERYQVDLLVEQSMADELLQYEAAPVAGTSTRAWLAFRVWLQ